MDVQTIAAVQLLDLATTKAWAQGDPKRRGPQPKLIMNELLGVEEKNTDSKVIAGSKMSLEKAKELYGQLQKIS